MARSDDLCQGCATNRGQRVTFVSATICHCGDRLLHGCVNRQWTYSWRESPRPSVGMSLRRAELHTDTVLRQLAAGWHDNHKKKLIKQNSPVPESRRLTWLSEMISGFLSGTGGGRRWRRSGRTEASSDPNRTAGPLQDGPGERDIGTPLCHFRRVRSSEVDENASCFCCSETCVS